MNANQTFRGITLMKYSQIGINLKHCFSVQTLALAMLFCFVSPISAQVNSGSDGSDGAFNPMTNTIVNMADHPNGVYQYTSVSIPSGVTVTFIPNANNTPVTWLVQSNCVIYGWVDLSGQAAGGYPQGQLGVGGLGGPGGFKGGDGGIAGTGGQGPGAGVADGNGRAAAFGDFPAYWNGSQWVTDTNGSPPYGNHYLIPIVGGSGGGGSTNTSANCGGGGGGGGGGAILIAASQSIQLFGSINANGGGGTTVPCGYGGNSTGGGGSGGSVRLVSSKITGNGYIGTAGGNSSPYYIAGKGRVRLDAFEKDFSGGVNGVFTQGSQFTIIPTVGQGAQLTVTSVGGIPISPSPAGMIALPDAVLSAQQSNPVPIVVTCVNIPLNSQITVSVKPVDGAVVSAYGLNTGTLASSTATVSIVMPRGGGLVYATTTTGN